MRHSPLSKYMRRFAPFLLMLAAACGGGGGTDGPTAPAAVASVSVSASLTTLSVGQTATLTASPKDASGNVLTGRTVTWATSNAAVATVSAAGIVTAVSLGSATMTATVDGKTAQTTITVSASGASCAGVTPVSVAVGQVRTLAGTERSTLCLTSTGQAAEYVLIPANLSATGAGATVNFSASNTSTALGPPAAVQATQAAAGSVVSSVGIRDMSALQSAQGRMARNIGFERALRAREHELHRTIGAAQIRAMRSAAGQLRTSNVTGLAPNPSIGALVTLNAQSQFACSNPINRTGKVVAVSAATIVVEDTLRPSGGFSAAEYLSIATTFDTLIYAADTTAFGAPADIDGNGRIVMFFTTAVNQLTTNASGAATGVIGGFFFDRDLIPPTTPNMFVNSTCATSNNGEMFYLPVVDAGKTINNFFSDKAALFAEINGTTVHEFQHLINASRRFYITTEFVEEEEGWLNEGMSHIAEELLYYKVTGLSAKADLDFFTSRTSNGRQPLMDAYQTDNMDRFNRYLLGPESTSAYLDATDANDLQTRGATWGLLRYALDQSSGANATNLRALVNAPNEGMLNFNTVFSGIGGLFGALRGYLVALYTDNTTFGVAPAYTNPSWNFREWLPHFVSNSSKFPLPTRALLGQPVQVSLVAGGAAYLRFRVEAGATAGVAITFGGAAVSSAVDLILVRTQ